jgi:hypothetical protein
MTRGWPIDADPAHSVARRPELSGRGPTSLLCDGSWGVTVAGWGTVTGCPVVVPTSLLGPGWLRSGMNFPVRIHG